MKDMKKLKKQKLKQKIYELTQILVMVDSS